MKELKEFCKVLADESGEIIRKYFRTGVSVEHKKDESPVTIADKKAEEKMRGLIMKQFPGHGILGEEFGVHNENADYQWILDPIDGTKSFISGTVTFGTLIALMHKGNPLLGVINQPILNEFLMGDNETAELNGVRVGVRNCDNISDAVLLTTDHLNIEKYRDIEKFEALMHKVKMYRQWGDCYGYYLVATGFADVMIDPIMSLWDSMALIPVIKGAGGLITDYKGDDPVEGNSIIAASPGIHAKIINELN
ncbi:MAG: histidinol-phosphatase [Melioribacteraceae bacterium]|nr:histidinol-phosphatase [Melioribacteraceae bacterium]